MLKSSLDENATKITIFRNCFGVQLWVSLSFNANFAPVSAVFVNNKRF